MRTVKRNPFLLGVCAILGGAFLWTGVARAEVVTDRTAGILVYPKLIYSDRLVADGLIDTTIQLTNTSEEEVKVRCFYVNANSHCSNSPGDVCSTSADCQGTGLGGICIPGWQEIDFEFTLTPRQPVSWNLSTGALFLPLKANVGSIPGANEDPFYGELKCVQVGLDDEPVERNDLKGEASIVTVTDALLDARAYNAIGIQAIEGANDFDNTLVLGEEYNGCPNILILDHFFDDAIEPITDSYVRTDLTLVPCSQDFELQDAALFNTTVQFLVFNEFEQRFSTSRKIRCFKEFSLSAIDVGRDRSLNDTDPTSNSEQNSIFNVNVQGTLTGQTRIRGVDDGSDLHGNGLIGIAEEFHRAEADDLSTIQATAAFNIHQDGVRATPDIIRLP